MTPADLAAALRATRAEMETVLAGLGSADLSAPGRVGTRSVADVLTHLTAWEAELVTGLARVQRGQSPPRTQYTPADIDAQNARWEAENRARPAERVLADFHGVRKQTLRLVEGLSEKDLNAPRPWLQGASVADWIREWVLEHEREHAHELAAGRPIP